MDGIEIKDYTGEGYKPVHDFNGWRVAYLNCGEKCREGGVKYIERHNESDEVFVLLCGSATMLVGEKRERLEIEKYKTYVVKKGVYHAVVLSEDARFIIVENSNTSKDNSDYIYF